MESKESIAKTLAAEDEDIWNGVTIL